MPKGVDLKVFNNLEAVGDMVGSLKGISEGLDEPVYMENIIKVAHGKATNAFDLAAAATGAAGHLQHVFEFGVQGVTRGPVKFVDPTDEMARLWVHRIDGRGGDQSIGYSFRPAFNRNPQPTTEYTGVPSKYLRKLSRRKYVFWNKAFVMETGQTVQIKATRGDFLFVPFNKKPARNPLNTNGHVFWNSTKKGPITNVPGQTTKGTFTAFWLRWWASQGKEVMENSMKTSVNADIEAAEARAVASANKNVVKPAQTVNIATAASRSRLLARRQFGKGMK